MREEARGPRDSGGLISDGEARFRARLRQEIGDEPYERYFARGVRIGVGADAVEVIASPFRKAVMAERFLDPIRRAALQASPHAELRLRVDAESELVDDATPPGRVPPTAPRATRRRPRAPARRYRLHDFVRGESNRLAVAAAESLVHADNPRSFSPLFIHGGSGLGKTHLAQGAANEYQRLHPAARVRYLTVEAFTNDFVEALRHDGIERFRKSYRGLDMLCLDDVQFLTGKEKTQAELLHTFDALSHDGARVLLASDEHPRQIADLMPALASRFVSGAVVRLDPPDAELRVALASAFASQRGMRIEPEAVRLIAERSGYPLDAGGSVRELEGIVTQVAAVTSLLPEFLTEGGVVGVVAVRRALGLSESGAGAAKRGASKPVRIAAILEVVSRTLRVDQSEVLGSSRHRRVVLARGMAVYLARELTTHSFPEIARALHRPSHSTIVTADKRTREMVAARAEVRVGPDFDGLHAAELAERLRRDILERR